MLQYRVVTIVASVRAPKTFLSLQTLLQCQSIHALADVALTSLHFIYNENYIVFLRYCS